MEGCDSLRAFIKRRNIISFESNKKSKYVLIGILKLSFSVTSLAEAV